jgi:hypothetical protein
MSDCVRALIPFSHTFGAEDHHQHVTHSSYWQLIQRRTNTR